MNQTKTPLHTLLALTLALTLPALSLTEAMAQECTQDADCESGDICQLSGAVGACSVDDQGTVTCDEPAEPAVGFCYTPPPSCMSDAECGPFTECVFAEDDTSYSTELDCVADMTCPPDEEPAAPEESAPSEGVCAPKQTSCEADSDCPSSFHCETYTYEVGCVAPAAPCAEGEECPEPAPVECDEMEAVTQGVCLPNEIECDSDAACPADWRCVELEEVSCSSGGSVGSSGSSEGGAPEADPVERPAGGAEAEALPPIDDTSCVSEARSLCVPSGWESGVGFGAGAVYAQGSERGGPVSEETTGGELNAGSDAAAASGSGSVESGGCDAAGGRGTSHLTLLALALIALRALVRRSSPVALAAPGR
jgi:hypothetical protein